MNQSIQFEVENSISRLLREITGLNVYPTNRIGRRLFPYVTISASINSQILGNYTGVYELNVAVSYSDTAVKASQEDFDSEYCNIFEVFYSESPNLATKMQNEIRNTKVYMARIASQTPTIRTPARAWQRGLILAVMATPDEVLDGIRYYDFSEHLNSFYITTI